MSGVTLELHHLALSAQGVCSSAYRDVLELLGATARIDVIAGTSAGGLNGAFLALALAHRRDLALLRDLWTDSGALELLLRPAGGKNPPSLLQGDGFFLPQITEALRATVSDEGNAQLGQAPLTNNPIELILTGTLWTGRKTPFTDDMGVGITERDYDALFRFTRAGGASHAAGDLDDKEAVIPQLASAARCTSSFPGAFEPHRVTTQDGPGLDLRWPSSAGLVNFRRSQYVIDGGVLLNKPIRPALEAIYRQTGDRQVRRILAYVVPDPGEPPRKSTASAPAISANAEPEPQLLAGEVLLGVMTRLRSTDSVSRELNEIRDRNASVRARRRARSLLSEAMTASDRMPGALWEGYRAERTRSAATSIAHLIASGQQQEDRYWSERELGDGLLRYAQNCPDGFPFVPSGSISDALRQNAEGWRWGQSTVVRLGDLTVDFLKRLVWFARLDSPHQVGIVRCRSEVAVVLNDIRADRQSLDEFWAGVARGRPAVSSAIAIPKIPDRQGAPNQSASNLDELVEWLASVVPAWDNQPTPAVPMIPQKPDPADMRRAKMYAQVYRLAEILDGRRSEIQKIIDNPNPMIDDDKTEMSQLKALKAWLFKLPHADGVMQQMLRLDIVQFATAGATSQAEQEVELVQVSCSSPSAITGIQMHHFGAFYRAPWRVNDWIEGRLDGAKQIMRFLLSPERLRQRGFTHDQLCDYLRQIAVPVGHPDEKFLAARWNVKVQTYSEEVDRVIAGGTSTASALGEIAGALAMPIQLEILRQDLEALAASIREEGSDRLEGSAQWLTSYDAKVAASPRPAASESGSWAMSASDLWALRDQMDKIGTQRVTDDVGSDTFARTVSQAATVTAGVLGTPPNVGKVKAVRYTLSSIRGYTGLVWTMISYMTRGSAFGIRVVELAVAIGGALLALTILVPGVPLALTLAGVVVLLSGVTAAALKTPSGRWFGARLGVALLLVTAWLAYLIWRDININGWARSGTLPTLIKAAIGALIVLLGSYVAQSKPSKTEAWSVPILIAAALLTLIFYQPW